MCPVDDRHVIRLGGFLQVVISTAPSGWERELTLDWSDEKEPLSPALERGVEQDDHLALVAL